MKSNFDPTQWYGTFSEPSAEKELETEKEDAKEAKDAVEEGNKEAAHDRLDDLEARIAACEEAIKFHNDKKYAAEDHNHDHQMPPGFNALKDALEEMERDEHAPENIPFWRKPILGG